jgi:hypothetical protein
MPRTTFVFTFSLALALAACGGDSITNPGNGDEREVKTDPSFATDVFEIFTRRGCTASTCHGGGQGGLTMTTASGAYGNLVNVASPVTQEVRVIPGNAADSYLVKKLEGTASVGERMPLGGNPLDATDLQNVKNWINQGAKNN